MKYWSHLILILIIGFFIGQWFPWWTISIVAILLAFLLKHKFGLSMMFGFLAGFLLWAGYSLYLDVENHGLLSSKIGMLFGGYKSTAVIAITGVIGGLIVGLGSAIGAAIRDLVPNYLTE